MSVTGISVVTPTYGRVELVERLLHSLQAAGGHYSGPWEAIIVDTSPEPAAGQIKALCERYGARYTVGPWRVGAKRNAGAALARYDLVLFIDSDCAADEQLFAEHVKCYSTEDVGAVIGLTRMHGESSLLWRVLGRSREYNIPYSWPRFYWELPWGTTSNFSIRRATFERIGGFDEQTWTLSGGEDVDLGVRVWEEAGQRVLATYRASVRHARDPISSPFQVFRKLIMHGEGDGWTCTKHPHRTIIRINPIVILSLVVLAAVVAALVTLSAAPLLFGVAGVIAVWIGALLTRLPLRGPDKHLEPLVILIDWGFDVGTFWGALRHRKLGLAMRRFYYLDRRFTKAYEDPGHVPPAEVIGADAFDLQLAD